MKKETVKYKDIPIGHCFTFKHAVYIQNENEDFYMCDKYGHYVPYSMVMEIIELSVNPFVPTLKTGYTDAI